MIYKTRTAGETRKRGREFAKGLRPSQVVGLFGELGTGKTTFVQGMAEGLGIDPAYYVNSPTFTLINEYPGLIHIDLYRIQEEKELETLALEDYLEQKKIVVIEWAEKYPFPYDYRVQLKLESSGKERHIEIV